MDNSHIIIKVKVFDTYLLFGCVDDALKFCSCFMSCLDNVVCELYILFDNGKSQENCSE